MYKLSEKPCFPPYSPQLDLILSLNLRRGQQRFRQGNLCSPCSASSKALGMPEGKPKMPCPSPGCLGPEGKAASKRKEMQTSTPFGCCCCSNPFKIMFGFRVLLITYTGVPRYLMPARDGCSVILYKREHICFLRLTAHNLLLYNAEYFEGWCLSAWSIKARPP